MPFNEYLHWKKQQPRPQRVTSLTVDQNVDVDDDCDHAMLCPDCGRILRRYHIIAGLNFTLDRCGSCNGIWFDGREWDALKRHGWHMYINEFFTEPWQERVQDAMSKERLIRIYQQKFGEEEYDELLIIKIDPPLPHPHYPLC